MAELVLLNESLKDKDIISVILVMLKTLEYLKSTHIKCITEEHAKVLHFMYQSFEYAKDVDETELIDKYMKYANLTCDEKDNIRKIITDLHNLNVTLMFDSGVKIAEIIKL